MSYNSVKKDNANDPWRKKIGADDLSVVSQQALLTENMMSEDPPNSSENYVEHRLSDALDKLAAQSDNLRRLCSKMADAARSTEANTALISQVLDGLKFNIPHHFSAEANELFPLLRSRARKDDDFAAVMTLLLDNHASISAQLRQITPRLDAIRLDDRGLNEDRWLVDALTDVAARLHRHMSLLNAVIIPIARLRLSEDDLKALAQGLRDARSAG